MKNILALGICLAAFNAYAQESEDMMTQDLTTVTVEVQTKDVPVEFIACEQAVEETYSVVVRNAEGQEETVEATVINLAQTKDLFETEEAVEFFTTKSITSEEAFDSVVNLLGQIQDQTVEIEGNRIPVDGISLTINARHYFIKSSEFATLQNENLTEETLVEEVVVEDAAAQAQENSDLNS